MLGSYLIPRSICSWIPKPKFPDTEKLSLLNSYSRTLRPRSRISSALAPRTVQWTAIFSLRRIPKDLTVYLALEKTGCWPVSCSNTQKIRVLIVPLSGYKGKFTFAALVSLSPDSPTQIFKHNLRMCKSLMGFFVLSLTSRFSFFATFATGYKECKKYQTLWQKRLCY